MLKNTSWAERYLSLAYLLLAIAIVLLWVTVGYFEIAATSSLSFFARDGHCTFETMLGSHCFGDFAVFESVIGSPGPWDDPVGYPASAMAFFVPFFTLSTLSGVPWLGLAMYLLVLAVSTLVPAIWAGWPHLSRMTALIVVIGLGAGPVLAVLDRGNSAALLVAPLLVFSLAVFRNERRVSITMIVLLTAIKPHMILMVLVYVARRQWRNAILGVLGSVAVLLISFAAWPGGRWDNFSGWVSGFFSYSEYQPLDVSYPYNLSLTRSMYTTYDAAVHFLPSIGPWRSSLESILGNSLWITLGLLILVTLTLFFRGQSLDLWQVLLLPILVIIIGPGVSYNYYLVLLLVPVALILRSASLMGTEESRWAGELDVSDQVAVRNWFQVILLSLLLAPVLIPWNWFADSLPYINDFSEAGLTQLFAGPIAAALLGVTLLFALLPPSRRQADNGRAEPAMTPSR
jgi:hypothetical protein